MMRDDKSEFYINSAHIVTIKKEMQEGSQTGFTIVTDITGTKHRVYDCADSIFMDLMHPWDD